MGFPDKVGDGPITVKYRFRKRVKKAGIGLPVS